MSETSDQKAYLLLLHGDDLRIVSADHVLGEFRLPTVTPVPMLPDWFLGLFYHGGEVFPLFDWKAATSEVPFNESDKRVRSGQWNAPALPVATSRLVLLEESGPAFGLAVESTELIYSSEIEGTDEADQGGAITFIARGGKRYPLLNPVMIMEGARARLAEAGFHQSRGDYTNRELP